MYGDIVRDVEHASGAAGVGVTTFLMNLTDAFIFRPDTGCRNRSEFPTHIVRSGLAIAKKPPKYYLDERQQMLKTKPASGYRRAKAASTQLPCLQTETPSRDTQPTSVEQSTRQMSRENMKQTIAEP